MVARIGDGRARSITAVIIGAGHAGLAMSRCLAVRAIDHVVLERGEVAHSWRTERWDSLRLLTPNWQSRLPDFGYQGDDPDGYRTLPEVVDFIGSYAKAISAPVRTYTTVTSVRRTEAGYLVRTSEGDWQCRALVLASGACNIARVPAFADRLPASIAALTSQQYRNPDRLPDGGVLVVGASSSGTQIACELQRSGRPVVLSVGEHIRAPRLYRGRDLEWWMDATGVLDERYDQVDDIARARRVPSLQLAGTPDRSTLDLNALTAIGVRFVGRLAGITEDGKAQFAGSLPNMCALSDLKMRRLLDLIDERAREKGLDALVDPPHRLPPTRVEDAPPLGMNLASGEIRTVIWAAGYRPDHSWLEVPVLDRKGMVRHDGGVVCSPGMYLMGAQFLRRRKSALIDGAGDDARDLSAHLASYLDRRSSDDGPSLPLPAGERVG
jgi:putative flavoprotein involved in K+ transport